MSSWAGFTDEELFRLRQNASENVDPEGKSRKKAAINTAKRQRPREKIRTRAPSSELKASSQQEEDEVQGRSDRIPAEQRNTSATSNSGGRQTSRLDSREEEKENSSPECERRGKTFKQKKEENSMSEEAPPKRIVKKVEEPHENAIHLDETPDSGSCTESVLKSDLPEIIDENDKIQAIELSALEKMQERQKKIEQENKRKKAALQQAIKQRYQRTQAEAHTLSLVQKELRHLDSLLSVDVAILRDKIEESSREYLNAQKRYERAEKEFVEAKVDLHRKTERKDLLTEHLYTIIRENELRKAKKLEELMAKLNVATDDVLFEQQTDVLYTGNDDTSNKQNNSEVSATQEEKLNTKSQELNPESNDCQVNNVAGETTATNETKVEVTTDTSVTEMLPENEVTVTS